MACTPRCADAKHRDAPSKPHQGAENPLSRESGSMTLPLKLDPCLETISSEGELPRLRRSVDREFRLFQSPSSWFRIGLLDFESDFAARLTGLNVLRTQHVAMVDLTYRRLGRGANQQKERTNGDSIGPQAIVSPQPANLGVQSTCTPMPITDTEPQMQCIQSVWGE